MDDIQGFLETVDEHKFKELSYGIPDKWVRWYDGAGPTDIYDAMECAGVRAALRVLIAYDEYLKDKTK